MDPIDGDRTGSKIELLIIVSLGLSTDDRIRRRQSMRMIST